MITIAGGIILAFLNLFVVIPLVIAILAKIGLKGIAAIALVGFLGIAALFDQKPQNGSVAPDHTNASAGTKDFRYPNGEPPNPSTEPLSKVQVGPQGNLIGFDGERWVDVKTRRPYWDTDPVAAPESSAPPAAPANPSDPFAQYKRTAAASSRLAKEPVNPSDPFAQYKRNR